MPPKNYQQLETQLKTAGFTLVEPFRENEKGETIARVMNEKGEELLVTILPVSEGREPQYQFQLLGSTKSGQYEKSGAENAGKTFTLQESELEKGLPLIQKNPNQAFKLKNGGWNFATPLAGIAAGVAGFASGMRGKGVTGVLPELLPMPPAGTTKKLAKSIMAQDLTRDMAEEQAEQEARDAAKKMAINAAGLQALEQMGKLPTLPEMLKNHPQKKPYTPQMPDKIRVKIPTGKVAQTEKSVTLDKLRGEIPLAKKDESEPPQTSSPESGWPGQPLADLQQPQEEEIPIIPFAQKGKSKKSRLVKYIAGGAVATGIGVGAIGSFPIFFG